MGFAGELTTIGLPEVFSNIAFNRLTGVMTVSERGREAAIYFDSGLIRAFRPGAGRSFDYVAIAERAQAASVELLQEASRRRRRRTLKELLKDRDGFDEVRFDSAVEAAVREELLLLFGWRAASFVFEEIRPSNGEFDKEQLGCDVTIDPQAVAVEAARRVDEWETIAHRIDSERDIFLPVAGLPEDAAPALQRLLERLDGTRDLRRIIEEMPHGRFHVLKMVAELAEAGVVARATPDQLVALAEDAKGAGEIHRAVAHLEAALAMGGPGADIRSELVRLYQRSGRSNDAAKEFKRLGRIHEEKGDLDTALESYERAAELVPYDVDVLQRVAEIHDARGEREAFMRAGLRLAEALSSQRLHEECLEVYRRLLELDRESVLLREAIASTYTKMHEPKMAARELLFLAKDAWKRSDFERAVHYYRNVLAVDHDCTEAKERIEEIEERRQSRHRRSVRRRILAAVAALLGGLAIWQGVREWHAQAALNDAAARALSGLPHRPLADTLIEGVAEYAAIVRRYPSTRGAAHAEEAARALLVDTVGWIRRTAASDPEEASRLLARLGRIRLPDSVHGFWHDARDELLEEIAERK